MRIGYVSVKSFGVITANCLFIRYDVLHIGTNKMSCIAGTSKPKVHFAIGVLISDVFFFQLFVKNVWTIDIVSSRFRYRHIQTGV